MITPEAFFDLMSEKDCKITATIVCPERPDLPFPEFEFASFEQFEQFMERGPLMICMLNSALGEITGMKRTITLTLACSCGLAPLKIDL